MLQIFLLGQFKLEENGQRLSLRSRRAQSLLAYLMMHRGARIRRELIAGLLWPDLSDEKARTRLRYAIWQLRKAVGEEYLSVDKIEMAFNVHSEYWIDIDRIEQSTSWEATTHELIQSLAVYEGELLPGFYEDWVLLERDRLGSKYDALMELLMVQLVDQGRWRETVEWAEKWISLGHTPEAAYRALMVAHKQLGDLPNAMMSYQRCKQALDEQLAVEPSAETRRIYESITDSRPVDELIDALPTSAQVDLESSPPVPLIWTEQTPLNADREIFVSRENELEQLKRYFDRARSGQGQVIVVKGDSGRGKTSLLREFGKRALTQNGEVLVIWGNCEAFTGQGDSYLPFRDAISALTGDLEGQLAAGRLSIEGLTRLWNVIPSTVDALVESGPELVDSFLSGKSLLARIRSFELEGAGWLSQLRSIVDAGQNRPVSVNIQHTDVQRDLFKQYVRVLQHISRSHPLVVILDDLQWSDPGSTNLLFHLGRRIQGYKILIVGSYRPAGIELGKDDRKHPLVKVIHEFRRLYGDIEIDLDLADEEGGRSFVNALLDAEPNQYSEALRKALYQHTGGHPLFTVELLHQMRATGELIRNESGSWVEGRSINWDSLPPRIEAVIASRMAALPDNLVELLKVASVEGQEFTVQVVAGVMRIGKSEAVRLLSQELANRYDLVEAVGVLRVGELKLSRYRFRHHLFHTYVYNTLDQVELTHLHEEVGTILEAFYVDRAEDIAVRLAKHFEVSKDFVKTVDYLLVAGDSAKRVSDNVEAIDHLTRGLALLEESPEGPDRIQKELDLTIALSAPLVATKGYTAPEVEAVFERAVELCRYVDAPSRLTTARWGLWSFYLVRGQFQTAYRQSREIYELAQLLRDSDLLLIGNWTLGITLVHLGDFERALEHLDMAIEQYDPERQRSLTYRYGQNPGVTCLIYSAFALFFLGYPDLAQERCLLAIELAEESDHVYSLVFVHGMVAVFYAVRKETDLADHHANKTVAKSKKAGFPFLLASGLTIRGWVRSEMGKKSMTTSQMNRGLATMRQMGANLGRSIFLALQVESMTLSGQLEEGQAILEDAICAAKSDCELLYESELHRLQGILHAAQGADSDKVLDCFQKAIEIAQEQNSKLLEIRARTSMLRSFQRTEPKQSRSVELSQTVAWFTEGFDTPDLVDARTALDNIS